MIVPRRRFGVASALLLRAALCLSILASAALGSVRIPWADVASVSGGGVSRPAWNEIDWQLLPTKALVALCGGLLALVADTVASFLLCLGAPVFLFVLLRRPLRSR